MSFKLIKLRRGTATQWTTSNPVLRLGEPGVETDTNRLKIGNGVSAWNTLSYIAVDSELIDDRISSLLLSGQFISINYNDNSNFITVSATGVQPSGNYATLVNGYVPSSQLPSYVDDVLEYATLSVFPVSGESGKIYLDLDTKKIYRWSGSIYIEINPATAGGNTVDVVSLGNVSGTINTDASSGDIFDLTLVGSGLLADPTNGINGQTLRWRISQDNIGNRSLSFGNKFKIPSTATNPLPISIASGAMDTLAATYHSGRDKWDIIAFVPGY